MSSPPFGADASASSLPLRDSQAITKPITIAHNATFPEVYEAFSSQGCVTIVVVNDQCPVGYISCEGFLSLLEPVHSATFAGDERAADESKHLADESKHLIVKPLSCDFEPASGSGR